MTYPYGNYSIAIKNEDSLCCDWCNIWYHLHCTNLKKLPTNTTKYCYCMKCHTCKYCKKEITGDSICCIACNKWYHTKCAKFNKKKLNYKENRTLSGTAWCCMNEIFLFHQVENKKFLNLITQTNQIIMNYNKNCGICEKTMKQSVNSVHCENCKTYTRNAASSPNMNTTILLKIIYIGIV